MATVLKPRLLLSRDLPFLISIVSCLITGLLYLQAPPQIPLWYSLVIMEQHLAAKEFIFVFPILMLVISLIHTALFAQKKFFEPELVTLFSRFIYIPLFLLWIALLKLSLVIL